MEKVISEYGTYYRLNIAECFKRFKSQELRDTTPFNLSNRICKSVRLKSDGIHKNTYKIIHASFDIETTSINEHSYMYIWQFGFISKDTQYVVKGRTWYEFEIFMRKISEMLDDKRIIVWCHNLAGYEFRFMQKRYMQDINEVFAKENNHAIKFVLFENIEFRDTLAICSKSLQALAQDYCITQKLVGDLDYNILRNSRTVLTNEEECYCDNDVIILSEFSKYIFENYIIDGSIPLTQTGLLRSDIKHYLKVNNLKKKILNRVHHMFPSKKMYDLMMTYLFKGGLSNANYTIVNMILYMLDSYDFTSSYPAIMLQDKYYFPSEFVYTGNKNFNQLFSAENKQCVIAIIKFKNIRAKYNHNIISKSKCMDIQDALVLNGRVRSAKSITVFESEIDIAIYKLMYVWDGEPEIISAWTSERVQMPDYIRIPILNAYVEKSKRKENGLPYATEKSKVNSGYGMMVQRLIDTEFVFDNSTGEFATESITNYHKMIRGKFILPQVGIYITAWARFNLIVHGIYPYRETTYLYDTDSIKGYFDDLTHIQKYNDECIYWNKVLAEKYNVDFEYVYDLGCWDCETTGKNCETTGKNGKYEMFKTLGSKRYIYVQNGQLKQTVAGLGKKALYHTVKKANPNLSEMQVINKCFDEFKNNMYVEDAEKLKHSYFENVDDYVDGELMHEDSGIYLCESEFTLTMDRIFTKYVTDYQESIIQEKQRGY